MKTNRRDLIKRIGIGGVVAGSAAACGKKAAPEIEPTPPVDTSKITNQTIFEAEKLQGIHFTDTEREMMITDLEKNLDALAQLRSVKFDNGQMPATVFNPKLPRKKIASQKNKITLGNNYNAGIVNDEREIAHASVAQLGAWLRQGTLTSSQLTKIYLDRIDKYNDQLNCYITVTPEIARQQAQKADAELAVGRDRGPLHGIPYGLKDICDTKNVRTTWGAQTHKDRVATEDADIVRKLRLAGAVLLGKTSCGALAYGDQWFDALTRNPWNTEEGSSGSSAGSAAATAAGLCAFSIGTETLGSIVSPSERCGVVGLRPTFGRVSRAGVMSLCWSLDKVGPICRRVEDTAIVLAELNGYDADDPNTARMGFTYDGDVPLSDIRVGYVPSFFENGDAADKAALTAVQSLGVQMVEVSLPDVPVESLVQIVDVEAAAAFADLTLSDDDDKLNWQDPEAWPNTFRKARFTSAVDYIQIDRLRRRLMEEMSVLFEDIDVLIGPHFAGGALLSTNCTGHPQLALRAGFAQTPNRTLFGKADQPVRGAKTHETPRGISLWADLFQEGVLIGLGNALENKLAISGRLPSGF